MLTPLMAAIHLAAYGGASSSQRPAEDRHSHFPLLGSWDRSTRTQHGTVIAQRLTFSAQSNFRIENRIRGFATGATRDFAAKGTYRTIGSTIVASYSAVGASSDTRAGKTSTGRPPTSYSSRFKITWHDRNHFDTKFGDFADATFTRVSDVPKPWHPN
jgi:hypothetical protein